MPVGAAIGGAVIGAGGSIIAGSEASHAQSKAAQTAADSSLQVAQLNNQTFKDTRNQNLSIAAPFYNNGVAAGNALTGLLLGSQASGGGGGALAGYQTAPVAGQVPVDGTDFRAGLPSRADWANGALSAIGVSPGGDPIASLQGAITHLNPAQQRAWAGYLAGNPDPDTVYEQRQAAARQNPAAAINVPAPTAAGGSSSALTPFDQFRNSTNYQFRYDQGLRATEGTFATKGALDSGAAEKAKITFGQNLASGELSNYMNLLASQQAAGLTAAGAVMGVNTNYAGNVTAQNTNAANVGANAALQAGQANANMWGTIGNTAGQVGGALFQYGMGQLQKPQIPTPQSINVSPTGTASYFANSAGF